MNSSVYLYEVLTFATHSLCTNPNRCNITAFAGSPLLAAWSDTLMATLVKELVSLLTISASLLMDSILVDSLQLNVRKKNKTVE